MKVSHFITVAVSIYLALGAIVSLIHPKLLRGELSRLRNEDLGRTGVFWKPILALWAFLLFSVFWPIAWFNAGKSEKKAKEALAAQLERLRPFATVHAAKYRPVRYAGGDGSSFENAVIILDANPLSLVRAEHNYIGKHHPGYSFHRQCLKEHEARRFDVMEFATAAGNDAVLYFDISAYLAG